MEIQSSEVDQAAVQRFERVTSTSPSMVADPQNVEIWKIKQEMETFSLTKQFY